MSSFGRFAAPKRVVRRAYWRFIAFGRKLLAPLAAAFIVGFAIAALLFGQVGPEWLTFKFWRGESSTTSNSEIFRNLGLFVVAIIGLGFGIWRAIIAQNGARTARQQANLIEQGQITDRFTEAVKMLSDESVRTRVGAVYALARIAQDSIERDHISVMEVLSEFIRNSPYATQDANRQAEARQRQDKSAAS